MSAQGWGHILMMSPPVDPPAAAGKVAYAVSKFGMTLIAHGLAGEVADRNVALQRPLAGELIESYATITSAWRRQVWRKPDILADAALAIFAKEPGSFTGRALIGRGLPPREGATDFAKYRCDPGASRPGWGSTSSSRRIASL